MCSYVTYINYMKYTFFSMEESDDDLIMRYCSMASEVKRVGNKNKTIVLNNIL